MDRPLFRAVQDLNMTQELIESTLIALAARRNLNAVYELGLGDRGETDVVRSGAAKPVQNRWSGPLHDVRRDVRVQHINRH
jgi:hypothetical protein